MGRATEYFDYINREKKDMLEDHFYTHLTITPEIKKARRENLKRKKDNKNAK